MRPHLRAWYLIGASLVPPLWAVTDWHTYTHVAGRAFVTSYVALVVSPVLFVLGTRRLRESSQADDA